MTSFWEESWEKLEPERISSLMERFDYSTDEIIRILQERGLERICDAGCGCGVYALKLAIHGFAVSGFDVSENAVVRTVRLLTERGFPVQGFRVGDVLDTGYEDGVFDAVVSRDVLDHMSIQNAASAIKELLRVVRPGGCLLLTLDQTDEEYETEPHIVNPNGDYLFTDGKWNGMVFHPYSPDEIARLTGEASVEVIPVSEGGYLVVMEK